MSAASFAEAPFRDRVEAGVALGEELRRRRGRSAHDLVLGLPRGGVVVAAEVARALRAPLGALVVRKLGVPGHEELAFGAVASGGLRVLDPRVVEAAGLDAATIEAITRRELAEIARRERLYGVTARPQLRGRTVILVDDGLATGSTMRAAVRAVRTSEPRRVIVAVPVAPPDTVAALAREADEVLALLTPEPFYAVGAWYRDFEQVSDEQVRELLARFQGSVGDDPSPVRDEPSSAPPARHWFAEHTGELELEIEAPTLEAVFAQALRALAELLEGPGDERAGAPASREVVREVVIESSDRAALLADWLSELVYLADRDGFVPEAIDHIEVGERTLKATVRGHIGQPSSLVKAATYHRLELAPAGDRWRARVVLDV